MTEAQERITYDEDGTLDEIVLKDAWVHLEHMGDGVYMLIVENKKAYFHLQAVNVQPFELQVDDAPLAEGNEWRDGIQSL
jgi:hypothetical protein